MPLTPELDAALTEFAVQPHLLACLDFDGCVAELVADAHTARPVPENAAAIDRLAQLEGITLAYVSGRPLETLRELASPPQGTLLFGSHGAERWLGPDSPGLELTAEQSMARTQVLETLEAVAAEHEGAWVEHKPAGGALHVRHITDQALGEQVLDTGRTALSVIDGAYLKEGKQILEAVVVKSTKGEAIQELRMLTSPDAVLFAGDDVTDEHGFAVLAAGDIGVKVGEGETKAAYRIPKPRSLAEVLNRIAELRAAG
ncbi:trehalose-phosphatase [Nesterenkonia ebinurensis]|uniref:trehalose-phosphatase n=1 Tax=Nesterenkonia ebinurensis TaxID=2608252 RepID=UPI00168B7037|nr:trehalose-phosphatase [Nesterenkonia ebinurensis]